jgi:hypothetical protein
VPGVCLDWTGRCCGDLTECVASYGQPEEKNVYKNHVDGVVAMQQHGLVLCVCEEHRPRKDCVCCG